MPLSEVAPAFLLLAAAAFAAVALLGIGAALRTALFAGPLAMPSTLKAPPAPFDHQAPVGQPLPGARKVAQAFLWPRVVAALGVMAWSLWATCSDWGDPTAIATGLAILIAGLIGGLLVFGPDWLIDPESQLYPWPQLGTLLSPYALALTWIGPLDVRTGLGLGAAIGVTVPVLVAYWFGLRRPATAGAPIATAFLAIFGAVAWGDRANPTFGLGGAWPLVVMAALGICALASSGLRKNGRGSRADLIPMAITGILVPLVSLMLAIFVFKMPEVWAPVAWGTGLALACSLYWALATDRVSNAPVATIILGGLIGGMLLLVNRLFHMAGVGSSAVGLCIILLGRGRLASLALGLFGGRMLLGLYLDQHQLLHLGVDVLQTQAFAALVVGVALPVLLIHLKNQDRDSLLVRMLGVGCALSLPVFLGYLLGPQALAAFMAGLLAGSLVWGLSLAGPADGIGFAMTFLGFVLVGSLASARFLDVGTQSPPWERAAAVLVATAIACVYAVQSGSEDRGIAGKT